MNTVMLYHAALQGYVSLPMRKNVQLRWHAAGQLGLMIQMLSWRSVNAETILLGG